MRLAKISFAIPEEVLFALNEDLSEFTSEMRLLTALHLFKTHKLSLGKAVKLAGTSKENFIFQLNKFKIPLIDYEPAELEAELKHFEK